MNGHTERQKERLPIMSNENLPFEESARCLSGDVDLAYRYVSCLHEIRNVQEVMKQNDENGRERGTYQLYHKSSVRL